MREDLINAIRVELSMGGSAGRRRALGILRAIEGTGYKVVGKTCTQDQWEAIGAFVPDPTAFCFHELWEIAFNAADTFGGEDNG